MVVRIVQSFRILALALLFIYTSTYFLFPLHLDIDIKRHPDRLSSGGDALTPSDSDLAAHLSSPSQSPPPPNITIIAIWNPKIDVPPHAYLPNFFASVQTNPQIHLLFVVFDKFHYGCDKRISPVAKNIQEICFDTETYWRLHLDFLCQRWDCTAKDKIPLFQMLLRRSNGDIVRADV
jgi:hypothetical protein